MADTCLAKPAMKLRIPATRTPSLCARDKARTGFLGELCLKTLNVLTPATVRVDTNYFELLDSGAPTYKALSGE